MGILGRQEVTHFETAILMERLPGSVDVSAGLRENGAPQVLCSGGILVFLASELGVVWWFKEMLIVAP